MSTLLRGTLPVVVDGRRFEMRVCFEQARCDVIAAAWPDGAVNINELEKGTVRSDEDTSLAEQAFLVRTARVLAGGKRPSPVPLLAHIRDAAARMQPPAPAALKPEDRRPPAAATRVLANAPRMRSPRT